MNIKKHTGRITALILILSLTVSMIFTGCQSKKNENPPDTSKPEETEKVSVNLKDDFYAAVNEKVLSEHQNGDEVENWNWFYDLIDKAYEEEKAIIQEVSKTTNQADKKSSAYKLGSLYLLAMDQDGRNTDGVKQFNELMKPVMDAKTVQEFMEQAALLQYHYGFDSPLNTKVLALDENPGEYVVQIEDMNFGVLGDEFEDEESEEDSKLYFEGYFSKLLVLAGYSEKDAKQVATATFAFVGDIAKSRGKENKYKKISTDELDKLISNVNLQQFLGKIYRTMPKEISVRETDSLKKLNAYLKDENLSLLKNYVYMINLDKYVPYLTSEMIQLKYDSEVDYMGDADPINAEKTAVTQVAELLKWDMGKLYTEKNFDSAKKDGIQKIMDSLFSEYRTMIQEKDWLSANTKEKALKKLDKINIRVGMPEDIERYLSSYNPVLRSEGGSYFSNVIQIRKETSEKQYDSFGSKVDRTVWNLLPQDMNPCYYPTDNSINIPVAALEAPYFSATASEEQNLGSIGTIIAHEITHAFDDLGSLYDENGDYITWWSDSDRKEFEKHSEKIIDYYSSYKTPGIMRQDGKQTLGENIADLGAMKCLSRIIEKKKLPAEKFFESYANIWASTSDAFSDAIMSGMDEHAADKVRVNAVLASCELFYKTYDIKEGDGMFIKPESRVELW